MIGKGPRSREVIESMVKHGAVYLAAVGGTGALMASCIKHVEAVAFEDLGPRLFTGCRSKTCRLWLQ